MGGGSLTLRFSEPGFFKATSRLLVAWELQSPPSYPNPGPELCVWGGCTIPPTRDYKTRRAMRDRQGQLPGFRRGPYGRCSLATGLRLWLRTVTKGVSDYNPHSAPRDRVRLRRARWLPGAVVTRQLPRIRSNGRGSVGDYKSHGAPQGGGGPRLAGPGGMTRAMEGSRARCGRGEWAYRCVEGEGALVFVDPVSSLGDPDSR